MTLARDLYRQMFLIRAAEEAIREHYHEDEMRTPMHMSRGAEAIAVGVCAALEPEDQVLTSYRSHAVYLAKTDDVEGFFLELYGKGGGPNEGRAGSMHLCDPAKGHMVSSAVVASQLPMALGLAWANKRRGKNRMVAAFFGDGALDQGVFWETLNIACLWKLPIIFICEDNGLAVETLTNRRWGFNIKELPRLFDVNCYHLASDEASDVTIVYRYTKWLLEWDPGYPCLLHVPYHRLLEHVGVSPSPQTGVNIPDPLGVRYLYLDPMEAADIERSVRTRVEQAIASARAAPYPQLERLTAGVLHGP